MNINTSTFCVVPFVQLNTRGKGDARVCCSIDGIDYGIPKNLTLDQINRNTYNFNTPVFNLSKDSITDMWNSKFMKDFRMKMFSGDKIDNCKFCYRMEDSGFTSKRLGKNKRFLEKVKPLLEEYYKNHGYVNDPPQWWEIRLSTKCNLSCIMCSPNLSSMMLKEYIKWENKLTDQMKGSLDNAKNSGVDYLSKSIFFKNQIKSNLKNVLYMEFRGGEVFADKYSIDFINEISETEFAKNITLDISTNATLITDNIVNILNKFKGGLLRFSIDGFEKQDEMIRYHTKWNHVINSFNASKNLSKNWSFVTQTCLQTLNCIGITSLLKFIDSYCKNTNNTRFHLGFTSVRGKEWLRHELVPINLRLKEVELIKEFMKTSWLCNKSPHAEKEILAINGLIKALETNEIVNDDLKHKAKEYYKKLNELRKIDYWKIFPHIEFLNE